MSKLSAKTTIYLDPKVKKFIKYKAVAEDRSLSEMINDYFADMLEDLNDIKDIKSRRLESSESLELVLENLGLSYGDIQR